MALKIDGNFEGKLTLEYFHKLKNSNVILESQMAENQIKN